MHSPPSVDVDFLQLSRLAQPEQLLVNLPAISWHPQLQSLLASSYLVCQEVLSDHRHFAQDPRRSGETVPDEALTIQLLDPPDSQRLRAEVGHLLGVAPTALAASDAYRRLVRELEASGDREEDVVAISQRVCLQYICQILGVPPPDHEWWQFRAALVVRAMDGGLDETRVAPGQWAREQIQAYLRGTRNAFVPGGLADKILSGASDDCPAAIRENSLRALLHAGYDTPSRFLAAAAYKLLEEYGQLGGWPEFGSLEAATDELVRATSVVQATTRICVEPTRLAGYSIDAGDPVIVLIGAANHDSARFKDPFKLDLARADGPSLATGWGAHRCLGSRLILPLLAAFIAALCESGPYQASDLPIRWGDTATLRTLDYFRLRRVPGRSYAKAKGESRE